VDEKKKGNFCGKKCVFTTSARARTGFRLHLKMTEKTLHVCHEKKERQESDERARNGNCRKKKISSITG